MLAEWEAPAWIVIRTGPRRARLLALIYSLEARRSELEKLLGPMPMNGPVVGQLDAALSELDAVIGLLRGVDS